MFARAHFEARLAGISRSICGVRSETGRNGSSANVPALLFRVLAGWFSSSGLIKPSAPQADSSRLGPHLSPKWYAPPLSGRLLRKAVVGYRAIAAAAGLAKSTLTMILTGEGLRIRRHHADRIRPWIEPPSQTAPSFGRTDGHCSTSCW